MSVQTPQSPSQHKIEEQPTPSRGRNLSRAPLSGCPPVRKSTVWSLVIGSSKVLLIGSHCGHNGGRVRPHKTHWDRTGEPDNYLSKSGCVSKANSARIPFATAIDLDRNLWHSVIRKYRDL